MRLRYTPRARSNLAEILDYLERRSPSGARNVGQRIRDVLELVRTHPHIGRETDEPGIRRIVARPYPYLIFYEPGETAVVVHAIVHAARKPVDFSH